MPSPESLVERDLQGQPAVRSFLENALEGGRLSHAYLFLGPAGSGKLDAAWALAQGALCPHGACGACEDCQRAERRTHPDVHCLRPESAQGYLVGQVRDLIDDLALAPIRASRKVYILDEAEQLTSATANALLKSLEEPPDGVLFILLATARDAVLPTVLSRCQVVPFRPVSPAAAREELARQTGAPDNMVRRALAVCPSASQARDFLASESRQAARAAMLDCLARLPRCDELDVLQAAKGAVAASKATLDEFKEAQQAVFDESSQMLAPAALRELEDRQKRELAARERSGIMEQLGAARSLLRDALCAASGAQEAPACDDFADAALLYARKLGQEGLARALARVGHAAELVRRNVSPQLAYEAMLLEIKEMLTCRP